MTRRIVPQVILDYVPKYQQEYYEQTQGTAAGLAAASTRALRVRRAIEFIPILKKL